MAIYIDHDMIPKSVDPDVVSDFRNHLFYCMKFLGLGEPTVLQYAMAYRLQHGGEEMQLQAGRGSGKSVLTACFASWLLLLDPNTTIMVISASANKATEFISMTRRILTVVPYMRHLEPGDKTKDNAFGFNTECRSVEGQDPSCYAKGITGQITGSHADWVIPDDVEIEKNSQTAESRERLLTKVGEIEQIRNPGKGGVRILGTPQTMDSIYVKLEEGYPVYKFPAIMPDPDDPVKGKNLDEELLALGIEPGEATQPERFPLELLLQRKAKIGARLFALHYELDTQGADEKKFPLRLSDLVVFDVDPNAFPTKVVWGTMNPMKNIGCHGMHGDLLHGPVSISDDFSEYSETVAFIDPSGRGSDETTLCIASFVNGYIVIHELIGFEGGYDQNTLEQICKVCTQYGIRNIRFESNMGDGMFGDLLRPVAEKICGRSVAIDDYRVKGQKELRIIDTLEPVMTQHRLIFNTRAIRDKETQKQITHITAKRGALRHDDRVDVLQAAVGYWADSLSLSVDKVIERNEREEYQRTVEAWKDDARRAKELIIPGLSGACIIEDEVYYEEPNILSNHNRRSWR